MACFESREITFVGSKQPSGSLPFLGKDHLEMSTGTIFVRLSVAAGVFNMARKTLRAAREVFLHFHVRHGSLFFHLQLLPLQFKTALDRKSVV